MNSQSLVVVKMIEHRLLRGQDFSAQFIRPRKDSVAGFLHRTSSERHNLGSNGTVHSYRVFKNQEIYHDRVRHVRA